jgi:mannosyltransferase
LGAHCEIHPGGLLGLLGSSKSKSKNYTTFNTELADAPLTSTIRETKENKLIAFLRQPLILEWFLVLIFTVVAFFLRRVGLGTQSLWFDEADLIDRASKDLPTIFGTFLKAGENGPLYTLFMHFWLDIAGNSEVAIRTPSMIAGTLAIPVMFLVGKTLCNRWVGLTAAFILTVSPYNIWYSQDAKMYPLALLLSLASIWLFLKGVQTWKTGWWVAYALITTIGFYIHVMLALIVIVQIIYYWLRREYWRETPKMTRRKALTAFGCLTLPYLPIAVWQTRAIWDGTVGETWFRPVGLLEMFNSLGRRFGVNRSTEPWESLGALIFAALVALGLAILWGSRSYRLQKPLKLWNGATTQELKAQDPRLDTEKARIFSPALFLSVYLIVPIFTFYVLTTRIPLFADRYLLVASPAYYLITAVALIWLRQKFMPLAVVLGGFTLAMMLVALITFSYTSIPQKEDWRGAMKQLSAEVRNGDLVFVLPGYLESAVRYYFKPTIDVPIVTIPQALLDGKDDPNLNAFIQKSIKGHERAWLIISPERYGQMADEREYVRTVWFDNNTRMFIAPAERVGVKIYGYSFIQQPGTNVDFFPRTGTTSYVFGEVLELFGYDYRVSSAGTSAGLEPDKVKQDDLLHLTLHWKMLKPDSTPYAMTVRLTDKDGKDLATTYESEPLQGYFPTTKWKQNEIWRDYRDIYIKVPPGQYFIEVTVHPTAKPNEPLSVSGAEKDQKSQSQSQSAQRVRLSFPVTVLAK